MALFLGLDCGGTTTRSRIEDENGNVVFEGKAGSANLASTPEAEIKRNLEDALKGAPKVDFVFGGFAGLLTASDRHRAINILNFVTGTEAVEAQPDFHAAIAADPETIGIVISGTGSKVASRTRAGVVKSGGGGLYLGDLGSAADIGRRAIHATILSACREEATNEFWRTLADLFGTDEPDQVVAAVYRSLTPAAKLARIAPSVVFDADRGKKYARECLDGALSDLADEVWCHAKLHHANLEVLKLSATGGLWEVKPEMLDYFIAIVERRKPDVVSHPLPKIELTKLEIAPVVGAVNLARELQS
ncbi:MAG: hypothetical protein KDC26_08215 [Armatimonadetes bacterium]|nr:hypothetical protein [Armatimonadota bacterium]